MGQLPRIGVLGGGQLGRMMILEGLEAGFRFAVLDPDSTCPSAQLGQEVFVGDYDDRVMFNIFSDQCDLVTFEFENVLNDNPDFLETHKGKILNSEILKVAQNRLLEKQALKELEIPCADFVAPEGEDDLFQTGWEKYMIKSIRGGYDGKGQYPVASIKQKESAKVLIGKDYRNFLAEKWVDYKEELSIIVSRSKEGEIRHFPVCRNIHQNSVLCYSSVGKKYSNQVEVKMLEYSRKLAEHFEYTGVLCVECFLLEDDTIMVNEIAPRPHNSGHITQDACYTSQFLQHIRCISGMRPGVSDNFTGGIMVNLLGDAYRIAKENLDKLPPNAFFHDYCKTQLKEGRKMGHINFLGSNMEKLIQQITELKFDFYPGLTDLQ